jgi:hypothetical protein
MTRIIAQISSSRKKKLARRDDTTTLRHHRGSLFQLKGGDSVIVANIQRGCCPNASSIGLVKFG